ncbi:hypothetical protein DFAR_4000022 [Desulfarculales bacterium]
MDVLELAGGLRGNRDTLPSHRLKQNPCQGFVRDLHGFICGLVEDYYVNQRWMANGGPVGR